MIMNYNIILSIVMVFLPYEMEMKEKEISKMIEGITPDIVTMTTYKASESETDSTPNITASGFKITNPKKHRIIAVSRDLKRKMKWGSKVRIVGAGKYDGTYRVHDLMNKRYKKRIDILIGHNDKQTKLKKVKIYKL
jgi:3D (Asp-Asp-Asp) domain-containing protein